MKEKSIRNLIIITAVTMLISGCSTGNSGGEKASIKDTGNGTDITKLLETAGNELQSSEELGEETEGLEDTEVSVEEQNQEETDSSTTIPSGDVNVDLTVLSSTMVYAEVYNMVTMPEDYVGKTIRIQGLYYPSYYDVTDKYYHYIVITDATACCQSGLEFIWVGNENGYPEDYPTDGMEVELTGVYGSYEELGQVFYYLATDAILVK